MKDELFNLLIQSAKEAKELLDGSADYSKYTIHIPNEIATKRIRRNLAMTQKQFAETFGFSVRTIGEWEQGRRVPEASARILLKLIDKEPEFVLRTLRAA